MTLKAAFLLQLLLLYLTCCQVLTMSSVDEIEEDEIDYAQFYNKLKEPLGRDSNPPDETTIDQKAGFREELEYSEDKDEDKKQMTEYEINQMLGYRRDEMILSNDQRKRGVGTTRALWPLVNGKLHVPYEIDSSISSGNSDKIKEFIAQMNSYIYCNTGTWRERTASDNHYVRFESGEGCASYLGVVKSEFKDPQDTFKTYQPITLAPDCITGNTGTVLHEMLHAMGFSHEHQRSDRDAFVTINFGNIMQDRERTFDKLSNMMDASDETPYDYGSVMHYGKTAFSSNDQDTIVPTQTGVTIGQRNGMSTTDKAELNAVYGCPATPTVPPTTTRRRRRSKRRRIWGKK